MDPYYDYKKFAILYVDDEVMSLTSFTRAFEDQFTIFTASNARDGLKILEERQHEIGVLMTDQKMPGEKGIWLLEKARLLTPKVIRILATAFSEFDVAIAAINSGAIYRYVNKPYEPEQLSTTLKRALEFFIVQQERDQLLAEKLSVIQNMMIADRIVSMGLLATGFSQHIRNSLQAVQTFMELAPIKVQLEKQDTGSLRDPEFWKEYYQTARHQLDRIDHMLKDLWNASEKPSMAFNDRVRVRDVAQEAILKLEPELKAKSLAVENSIPENLPEVLVDRPKFLRFFELMLKDEIASLPTGCLIVFSGTPVDEGTEKAGIQLGVSDNGPGMPKESLRLVFDPFTVRGDTPTEYGIHLITCYFIIHHHGGSIEAASEEGKGTTFNVRLPLNPATVPQAPSQEDFLRKAVLNESLWKNLISS